MDAAEPRPTVHDTRRWFGFRWPALLVLLTLCVVTCSWGAVRMRKAERLRDAAVAITRSRGLVFFDWQQDADGGYRSDMPPSRLRNLLWRFFPGSVVIVIFTDPITDADLEHVKELSDLQALTIFDGARITDSGLEHLKGLSRLQTLRLKETQVTAQGIKTLQQALPNCKIDWEPPTKDERQGRATPDRPSG